MASHLHQALSVKEGSLESQKELWQTITGACHRGVEQLGLRLPNGGDRPKEAQENKLKNMGRLWRIYGEYDGEYDGALKLR